MSRYRIFVAGAALILASCTDPNTAREAAEDFGLTDIEVTGYSPFSCGKDDTFSTGFTAKNAQGVRIKGVVCSGWLKGSTVRILGRLPS